MCVHHYFGLSASWTINQAKRQALQYYINSILLFCNGFRRGQISKKEMCGKKREAKLQIHSGAKGEILLSLKLEVLFRFLLLFLVQDLTREVRK